MESAKIWKSEHFSGIELLSASYNKFEFAKHWHDELAIGLIEEGAEGLLYRGRDIVVPKNHIIAINPSEIHTGYVSCHEGWRYRMFYFDLHTIYQQFEQSGIPVDPIIDKPVIDDINLFSELKQLHMALENSSFNLTKDSLLAVVLEKLFTRYGSVKASRCSRSHDDKSALQTKEYLLDNWQLNVSLEELEGETGRSKFQLIRAFKLAYGITPHQFLLLVKAQKAKYLLAKGNSCVETSLTCGFYDQSHFNRNFKRAFGITPTNYLSR
ncbi:helix-turn-helix transcriptional regulator [Vibrio tapetis]|uniref:Putative Transcriptional regulator, AraC family n=1 Tax=Vibrio tapetis subsp. tapetis TaxID=1671868 RepID=A0A2N8ZL07_9VIBR|nr:AraC family transcriptional regulator [Vibrio tapetis]SON52574.1 putative Transcriptional regulator, AraC family [Vibrio tapetis subsp. tapetis]